jgi:hypothetical protein
MDGVVQQATRQDDPALPGGHRLDYARFYSLGQHDDGVTLAAVSSSAYMPLCRGRWYQHDTCILYMRARAMGRQHQLAHETLVHGWPEVIEGMRTVLGRSKVMLRNSLGYSSLSMMPDYDGTFSGVLIIKCHSRHQHDLHVQRVIMKGTFMYRWRAER